MRNDKRTYMLLDRVPALGAILRELGYTTRLATHLDHGMVMVETDDRDGAELASRVWLKLLHDAMKRCSSRPHLRSLPAPLVGEYALGAAHSPALVRDGSVWAQTAAQCLGTGWRGLFATVATTSPPIVAANAASR